MHVFNSPKGRMLANFVLWREGGRRFRALVADDIAGADRGSGSRCTCSARKSRSTDVSAATPRFGLGGPRAADVLRDAWGVRAAPMTVVRTDRGAVVALPGPRYVLLADAAGLAPILRTAVRAPFAVWQWLTVRAGVPVVTAPLSDQLIAQAANLDLLGGLDFRKGCYTGQEIIARTQHLGTPQGTAPGLPRRPAIRLLRARASSVPRSAISRAASSSTRRRHRGAGAISSPWSSLPRPTQAQLHLDTPDGAALTALPLPYAIPAPPAPRGRVGAPS